MSYSNSIGGYSPGVTKLSYPLEFPDGTIQTTASAGSPFSSQIYTCDIVSASSGQIDTAYLLNNVSNAIQFVENSVYLMTINIPVFNISVGTVAWNDIILFVQLRTSGGPPNTGTNFNLIAYPSLNEDDTVAFSGLISVGTSTYLDYISLLGSYTPTLTTFDYGGAYVSFIKLT